MPDENGRWSGKRVRPVAPEKLAAQVARGSIPEPNSGCFLWIRSVQRDGYGTLRHMGRCLLAHRAAWIASHGEPPLGAYVLHTCDMPGCVNTAHLYLGAQTDNMRDAVRRKRHVNSKKTHCKRGHPLTGENLYSYTNKGTPARCCRLCHDTAAKLRKAR